MGELYFFQSSCKSISDKSVFGLCDDPPPAETSAYIDENDTSKWIGVANNSLNKDVNFYAIDHCIEILRDNGDLESRCDRMLHFDNDLIFVELKDRHSSKWLSTGRKQLEITIDIFKLNNTQISNFNSIKAYVCNKQRPLFHSNYKKEIQKFKDKTGFILNVKREIMI